MLRDGPAELRQQGDASSEEQAEALAQLERRLAALEAAGENAGTPASGPAQSQSAQAGAAAQPVGELPRRKYPDLVTAEAEPGEELVYGDDATAVIVRWREARDAFVAAAALDRLNIRDRRLRLEIELIEKHELTLPPATRPWDFGESRLAGISAERPFRF